MTRRNPPMTSNGRGATCAYCERTLEATTSKTRLAATRDHIHPRSKGGTRRVWCCRQCNLIKGCMTPTEWKYFRSQNPEWWRLPKFQFGNIHRPAEDAVIRASAIRAAVSKKTAESGTTNSVSDHIRAAHMGTASKTKKPRHPEG